MLPARGEKRAINRPLSEFAKEELVTILRRLYFGALSHGGKYYRAIGAGLDRYLNKKKNLQYDVLMFMLGFDVLSL